MNTSRRDSPEVRERAVRMVLEQQMEHSSKWAKIAKCSQDSAGRDIKDLTERGTLRKDSGGGRSTSYSIVTISQSQQAPRKNPFR
jgi:Fic family protein